MKVSPYAGRPAEPSMLVNVPRLVTAYYAETPDPMVSAQRVAFGTSGHRGSSFDKAFNEWHILAISQAICLYRAKQKIDGPLFLGIDTHALSVPASAGALEVLAANGVEVMLAKGDEYTPTPAVSHDRLEAPATPEQNETLLRLSAQQVRSKDLAGEPIQSILTRAPGNGEPIGGLKVIAESGWFAARPSGTENIYRIYAESFRGAEHLRRLIEEAQAIVNSALTAGTQPARSPAKTKKQGSQ